MTAHPAPQGSFDAQRALRLAHDTFDIEAAAVQGLKRRTGDTFARAVQAILAVRGRVVVTGMGKSGHIGRKIAATLASTGTPAMFVHPAEASHGDLGMIKAIDLVLAISNGGESDELTAILPVLKRQGVPLVAMTGNPTSTLARHADILLDCGVEKEACPLNLAPTASTTAQVALGDALAVALLDARGFRPEDFARSHPGGALGRKLLTHLADVMRTGEAVPRVGPDAPFTELMREISRAGLGASTSLTPKTACWASSPTATCAASLKKAPTCAACAPATSCTPTRAPSRATCSRSRPPTSWRRTASPACWWWMPTPACAALSTATT